VAFILGIYFNKQGVKLTGRPTLYIGSISSIRNIIIEEHPAIPGTAKTKLGYFSGVLLKLLGTV